MEIQGGGLQLNCPLVAAGRRTATYFVPAPYRQRVPTYSFRANLQFISLQCCLFHLLAHVFPPSLKHNHIHVLCSCSPSLCHLLERLLFVICHQIRSTHYGSLWLHYFWIDPCDSIPLLDSHLQYRRFSCRHGDGRHQ